MAPSVQNHGDTTGGETSSAARSPVCSSPISDYLSHLHTEFSGLRDGKIATYIPELAKADANWFGICLVTATGHVYEVGDSRQPFTIQSISKPFVYGLALEDHGRHHVLTKISTEPTGDAFNSISLEPGSGRPRNPMINAGAIAATSLIEGRTPAVRLRRLLDMFALYVGHEVKVDEAVYCSESETGHRNRAIGHMLRNFGILPSDPTPSVELYFQQCSVSVTARDLGVMAATLANRGVNPLTGKMAIRGEYVESVLSVMGSCGMYDFAGEWIYCVGMPAKSGVSGGIIAVLPGQLGIGVFSPPLDDHGNSVRGIRVCNELSRHCNLHMFNSPVVGNSTIRFKFTAEELNSNRVRTAEESQVLREFGRHVIVYQLQGELSFVTGESVVREVIENVASIQHLIVDLKRVVSINESACRLFYELLCKLSALAKSVVFTHADHLRPLRHYMKAKLGARYQELFRSIDDNDLALEWCENRLLQAAALDHRTEVVGNPSEYELFEGFSPEDLALMVTRLRRTTYRSGEIIMNIGDAATELFFLVCGRVSVFVPFKSGGRKRLAALSAGMVFGEMAIIDRAPRSAMIVAESQVKCDLLSLAELESLGETSPQVKIKFLKNLNLCLCRRLRDRNRKLVLFE
jgi:glutaminase